MCSVKNIVMFLFLHMSTSLPVQHPPCMADEFQCTDGNCISKSSVCDGVVDCKGGKDEEGCCRELYTNMEDPTMNRTVSCHDGTCQPFSCTCNGTPDCANGVDEEDCPCMNGDHETLCTRKGRAATSYCDLDSQHTMCTTSGPSESCSSNTIFKGLSEVGKKAILDRHNMLRRKVAKNLQSGQPGASDMRKLVWNYELETIAQRLTDQCIFNHDISRNKLDGTYVGQNLAWASSSDQKTETAVNADLATPVQNWYDEVNDPGFSGVINPFQFSSGAGHYTQLVWAETEEIGCGFTYYRENGWYSYLVACNYAVGGNFIGSSMYNTADSYCDNCPSGYICDDGLCVAV